MKIHDTYTKKDLVKIIQDLEIYDIDIKLTRYDIVKELYNYTQTIYPDQYAFFNYRGSYKRRVNLRSGVKIRTETSDRLRYYVKKWFKGVIDDSITPYFLRHSRFSQLSEAGVSIENIRFMKGARSVESVMPYLHLSTHKAKAISKKIKWGLERKWK